MTPRQRAQAFADKQNRRRKARYKWALCGCGHWSCGRLYPSNVGLFYQGSGFHLKEAKEIVAAFDALALTKQLDTINRLD